MRIENDIKLDFKDVLFRPKRSTLASRSEVDISRTFKMLHSGRTFTGFPVIAANMDGVGCVKPRCADIQFFRQFSQIKFARKTIQNKSHGRFGVMLAHQYNRLVKTGIANMRACDQ